MEGPWRTLPADLLRKISSTLNKTGDVSIYNTRLRSVCRTWRYSLPSPPPVDPIRLPFPYSVQEANIDNHFFVLLPSTVYLLQQPKRYQASSSTLLSSSWLIRLGNKYTVDATDGTSIPLELLRRAFEKTRPFASESDTDGDDYVTVESDASIPPPEFTFYPGHYRPLNLLAQSLTPASLPDGFPNSIDAYHLPTFHIHKAYHLQLVGSTPTPKNRKFIKSLRPRKVAVSTSSDPLVVAAIFGFGLYYSVVGEGQAWKPVDAYTSFEDIIYSDGTFYALDIAGKVVSFRASPELRFSAIPPICYSSASHDCLSKTLLFSNGRLFLIEKRATTDPDMEIPVNDTNLIRFGFRIYRLAKDHRSWQEVSDLEGSTFFIGDDLSFSINSCDFPAIKPNHICLCDVSFMDSNKPHGAILGDIGIYSLDERCFRPLADLPDFSSLLWPPPTWLHERTEGHL